MEDMFNSEREVDWVERYAQMPDSKLYEDQLLWGGDQAAAYRAEVMKRKALREKREQAEALRQRLLAKWHEERIKRIKDELQYSEEEPVTEICERISAGELLTVMCLDEHLPTVRRCNMWLKRYGEFKVLYDEALQDRLAIFEEQLIQIPDEAARDFTEVTKGKTVTRVIDPARITAAKLRVEVRRLHLKAGRPQKWGDTSTLITKSADEDMSNLSAEELERRIAEIEAKDAVVNGKRKVA